LARKKVRSYEADTALNTIEHPKKRAFLRVYAATCSIIKSSRAAKVSRGSHYHWLDTDPDYARAFNASRRQSVDVLEAEAMRRALEGVDEYVMHAGKPIRDPETGEWMKKRRFSDFLLFKLLQAVAPEKYRDNHMAIDEGDGIRVAGRKREDVIREDIAARQHALDMLMASRSN
jgi:hypothetical protein